MFSLKRSSGDFLVALSQPTDSLATLKYSAVVTIKDKRLLNISCSRNGADAWVELFAASSDANPFEGFKFVSILDDEDVVRSFNIVGIKTKQMSLFLHKNYVQKNDFYNFKILLVACSSSAIYKPSSKHPGPWGTFVAMSLSPPTLANKPEAVHPAVLQQTASSSQPTTLNAPSSSQPGTLNAASSSQPANVKAVSSSEPATATSSSQPATLNAPSSSQPAAVNPTSSSQPATLTAANSSQLATLKDNTTSPSPAKPQGHQGQRPGSADTVATEREEPKERVQATPSLPSEHPAPTPDTIPFLMTSQPRLQNVVPGFEAPERAPLTPDHLPTPSPSSRCAPAEEAPFDVLFYHYDPVKGTNNIIGAHRSILKPFPSLSRLVGKSEAARNEIASEMKLTTNQSPFGSVLPVPIVVDVSYLSFPAFKALIAYVYGQDVKTVLSNVSDLIPTSRSPSSKAISKTDQDTKLCLGELVFLAHRFEIRELFDVCVELTNLILSVDNAILILVHLGSEFEEIKRPVMKFIGDHFQEIFGRDEGDLNDPFEAFQDRRECHSLMAEILWMIARKDVLPSSSSL